MKLLFQFSGEHETLPKAELLGILEGENIAHEIFDEIREKRILILNLKRKKLNFLNRLALTKKVAFFIFKGCSFSKLGKKICNEISKEQRKRKIKTFAVRCKLREVEKELGEMIKKNSTLRVNLKNPDIEILCYYPESSGNYYTGINFPLKKDFEKRKPQFRPYFSPTSMHPKLARVLVNLARIKKGDALLDPFSGTGGILIEAALMGIKIFGIDFDKRAVDGCKKNLNFYNLRGKITQGDALKIKLKRKVDAIVTDMPYGRSSLITEKNLHIFYEKFLSAAEKNLKSGKYFIMVIPSRYKIKFGNNFSLKESFRIYVHKSLSRKIYVLRRK